jgi:hypothetical protein
MLMETPVQVCATLTTTPDDLTDWLRQLAAVCMESLPPDEMALIGPHTFDGVAPAPYETIGIYIVAQRQAQNISARRVALAVTYLPLHQPGIGLDLRVWSPFPATLDTLLSHFCTHFAQANPVVSSVASLKLFKIPQLACNRWLAEQLEQTPQEPRRLYPPWLEQYRCLRGDYPQDARRNFRAAVATWRRRRART